MTDTEPRAPNEEASAKDVAAYVVDTMGTCIGADKVFWPEIWRGQITVALDAFAGRAVAAERERCLRIIREEIAAARVGSVRGSIASIAAAIHRGE